MNSLLVNLHLAKKSPTGTCSFCNAATYDESHADTIGLGLKYCESCFELDNKEREQEGTPSHEEIIKRLATMKRELIRAKELNAELANAHDVLVAKEKERMMRL
jgi:hypothetical protein